MGAESQGLCLPDRMVAHRPAWTQARCPVPCGCQDIGAQLGAHCPGEPGDTLPRCLFCLLQITSWLASKLGEEDQRQTVRKLFSPKSHIPTLRKSFTCPPFPEVASELVGSFRHLPVRLKKL